MKRLVLLGASNLTSGLALAAHRATASAPGPWRLLVAAGYGRAYGSWSRYLPRALPPIADCGLWAALDAEPDLPTRALVADAGNDLAYDATAADTAAAVGRCLERLRGIGAEIVLVLPPAATVADLAPWRFKLYRTLLFPGRGFEQGAIVAQLSELRRRLAELAGRHQAALAEIDRTWLSHDGIHLSRGRRQEAWEGLLGRWRPPPGAPDRGSLPPLRWRFTRAEHARLVGIRLGREQPAARLADGSTVSLY